MSTLENIISANSAMQCNSEACISGSMSRANLAYAIVAYVCVCVCVCHYCWYETNLASGSASIYSLSEDDLLDRPCE